MANKENGLIWEAYTGANWTPESLQNINNAISGLIETASHYMRARGAGGPQGLEQQAVNTVRQLDKMIAHGDTNAQKIKKDILSHLENSRQRSYATANMSYQYFCKFIIEDLPRELQNAAVQLNRAQSNATQQI
jgi:hypothetical protein